MKWRWIIPASIVLLGLGLRLYHLDHESLWGDEVFGLAVSNADWAPMHSALVKDVVHPPLHYYLLHGWVRLLGFGAYQARLFSALFGTLAIAALYILARYLFDASTAALSALLLAVSQLSVQYSHEARMYALLLFLVICSAYFFIRALRERNAVCWWLFVVSAVLVEYTHYFGLLQLIALCFFGFMYRRQHAIPRSWWIAATAILLIFLGAWLASGIASEAIFGPKLSSTLGKAHSETWYAVFELVNVFNNGRPNGLFPGLGPWWTFLVGALLFTLPALLALKPLISAAKKGPESESPMFLLLLTVIPVVLALFIGRVIRFYEFRYLSFCVAPYCVLVAKGFSSFENRALRVCVVLAALAYGGYSLRANYFIPSKENFRDSTVYLAGRAQPNDCFTVVPPGDEQHIQMAWEIYAHDRPPLKLTALEQVAHSTCPRVWLIADTHGNFDGPVERAIRTRKQLAETLVHVESKSWFWIATDLYERSQHFSALGRESAPAAGNVQ
jgi:4-amino-4-deoxy-L-arabinose transferase-like glycosyltransferase